MKDYQNILMPYAYNILGSVEDAKDAVQEVLTKYVMSPNEGIENEKSYLTKSVINQAINVKNRRKKLSYGDVWLPEPVATEEADANINLRDIISYSMLVLLEQLNRKERAVFILKEAFNYSHEEIAEVLSSTIENSRKLLSRAKSKLNVTRNPSSSSHQELFPVEIIDNYINAIRNRDTKTLENMLSKDIVVFADGGDKVNVVKKTCTGIIEVIELLVFSYNKFNSSSTIKYAMVNHQPALLYYNGTGLHACQVLEFTKDKSKICQINTILDPIKLKNIKLN